MKDRLKRLLNDCLDQIVNDRYIVTGEKTEEPEECWCYDEVDGAPDAGPPGRCLACRIRCVSAELENLK